MNPVDFRRQNILWAIQQNPVEITIKRTTKVDAGGYLDEVQSEHGPYVVRIFQKGSKIPQEVSTLAGIKQVEAAWGLLADYETEIKAGANVLDEFEVAGLGKFQVVAVYPQIVQGEVIGYQADLEKVS